VLDAPHRRFAGARPVAQRPVHVEVGWLLVVPRELVLDALSARPPHRCPPVRVVEQFVDQFGKAPHVSGFGVGGGAARERPGLGQVERHERQAEGHVLHPLDRRDDLLEVRFEAEVRGREVGEGLVLGQPSGERDELGNAELVGPLLRRAP